MIRINNKLYYINKQLKSIVRYRFLVNFIYTENEYNNEQLNVTKSRHKIVLITAICLYNTSSIYTSM